MSDLAGFANRRRDRRDRERRSSSFKRMQIICSPARRGVGIEEDRDPDNRGRDLFEQFEPFARKAAASVGKSGGITAGPCEALNKAASDRVRYEAENNRDHV